MCGRTRVLRRLCLAYPQQGRKISLLFSRRRHCLRRRARRLQVVLVLISGKKEESARKNRPADANALAVVFNRRSNSRPLRKLRSIHIGVLIKHTRISVELPGARFDACVQRCPGRMRKRSIIRRCNQLEFPDKITRWNIGRRHRTAIACVRGAVQRELGPPALRAVHG